MSRIATTKNLELRRAPRAAASRQRLPPPDAFRPPTSSCNGRLRFRLKCPRTRDATTAESRARRPASTSASTLAPLRSTKSA
jgi:hypothetical protein